MSVLGLSKLLVLQVVKNNQNFAFFNCSSAIIDEIRFRFVSMFPKDYIGIRNCSLYLYAFHEAIFLLLQDV